MLWRMVTHQWPWVTPITPRHRFFMFWLILLIFEMGEARVFKFCTQVDHIKYYPCDDKLPQTGHGQVMWPTFEFGACITSLEWMKPALQIWGVDWLWWVVPVNGMCSWSCDFSKFLEIHYNRLIDQKWYNIQAQLQWKTNRKSCAYQMAPIPMTLSDLESYFSGFKPF